MNTKRIVIGALALVLIGAVVIGLADAGRTNVAPTQTGTQAAVQGQGYGAGVAPAQTGTQATAQGQSYGGGQARGQGNAGAATSATPGTPQPQANVTEWTTVSGTVTAIQTNGLSIVTDAGEALWLQLGQSRYWQAQGVTFNVNDHVTANGFYENGQYQAASVTHDGTGQTLTLRDSTGRPLWAGGNH